MAIPITCSGCNSTFEVPDNLAGKTIRCTSCKTQVTVSEPAADGKKPFGSGTPKQQSDAPAKAAAAPKSAPKGEAKAAPKSAAKTAADDEKTKPGKSSKPGDEKKSFIKGAPKKRRRDEDDEDDDDEDDDDDRPTRRKKKNEGAPGAMIAIIAAGAIGLAAIAGIGIWLATSGDDKKESASSSSTSSSESKAPTTPTGKQPDGKAGGKAGGKTGGKADGKTDVKPEGPRPGDPSGPGAAVPGPEGPEAGEGPGLFDPALFNLPGAAGLAPPGSPLAGLVERRTFGTPGSWATHTGDGFTADFPGTPEVINENREAPPKIKVHVAALAAGRTAGCAAVGVHFPADFEQVPGGSRAVLEQAIQNAGKGAAFEPARDLTVDGYPAKEADSTGPTKITVRAVVAKNRLYLFKTHGKTAADQAKSKQFLESLKITYKGGDPPAMPPTGAGGVAGGPGVPMPPNPGGPIGVAGGESGDGNLKTKIDPFFTAAFDAEKKEVYTIEFRAGAGGRVQGTLRRYGYPDFRQAGSYRIPHLGFRMVIDPKAELMYVAAATSPTRALSDAQFDRAAALGDVAIYDLKPIRNGKAADGKLLEDGAEVKPVATITLRSTIHGLDLSPDRKSLYVLATGSTKKPAMLLFDTTTRKETKRNELPEPVRDFVSAGDGQTLIVIEDMNPKTKMSAVRFFNAKDWVRLQATTLREGPTLDVAPLASGGMIASVLPLTAPPGGIGVGAGVPMGPPGGVGVGVGPGGGGPGGAGGNQANHTFQLTMVEAAGGTKEMDIGAGSRAANGGYVEYDPTNKKLFVGSWQNSGLDVYEVTDATAANGLKLKTSLKTAKREQLKGHFLVSPDGNYLLFHNGLVLDVNNLGGAPAGPPPGGMPIGPPGIGAPPPGGMPPIGPPGAVLPVPPGGAGPGVRPPPGAPPGAVPGFPGGVAPPVAPIPGG